MEYKVDKEQVLVDPRLEGIQTDCPGAQCDGIGLPGGSDECPANLALAVLGQKWTMLIVLSLVSGKARHSELRSRLGRLNSTTLSQRLKVLGAEGVVNRRVLSHIPPWVEYSLTEKGRELAEIISSLDRWGRKWKA